MHMTTHNDDGVIAITFGDSTIWIYSTGTSIQFADGRVVAGEPEDTDDYRATALRYGYGEDTLALCIDHEIMHLALNDWLGLPDSPTMHAVRHDRLDENHDLRRLEEAAVLAVQQYARAAGVDLRGLSSSSTKYVGNPPSF
jgi:hypothetical protein